MPRCTTYGDARKSAYARPSSASSPVSALFDTSDIPGARLYCECAADRKVVNFLRGKA
jgi:hypothetical protein